jgi:Trk K+ transport system NAD-binding subunit
VIVFGLGRYGSRLLQQLRSAGGMEAIGVDFDPEAVRALQAQGPAGAVR